MWIKTRGTFEEHIDSIPCVGYVNRNIITIRVPKKRLEHALGKGWFGDFPCPKKSHFREINSTCQRMCRGGFDPRSRDPFSFRLKFGIEISIGRGCRGGAWITGWRRVRLIRYGTRIFKSLWIRPLLDFYPCHPHEQVCKRSEMKEIEGLTYKNKEIDAKRHLLTPELSMNRSWWARWSVQVRCNVSSFEEDEICGSSHFYRLSIEVEREGHALRGRGPLPERPVKAQHFICSSIDCIGANQAHLGIREELMLFDFGKLEVESAHPATEIIKFEVKSTRLDLIPSQIYLADST